MALGTGTDVRLAEPGALTVRQKEILEYLRLGCTNQEISDYLNISVNTVKTHVAALYRELGAGNRTEAVHMASQMLPPLAATDAPVATPTLDAPPKVGVLPFGTPEGEASLGAEAAALTEAVSLHLSRWKRFPLIGHEACVAWREDVRQLHAKIGASYAVAASLHKGEAATRLHVRLLSTSDGQLHWAQEFAVPDPIQGRTRDAVSAHVGAVLVSTLLKTESLRAASRPAEALRPWEKMIRGLNALETRLSGECRMAADLFASALCESPGLLLAHYGLTVANYLGVLEQWDEQPELAKARIRENARACVRIDCDSPDTSLAMGLCHIVEGRVNDAISVLDQATEANPGLSSAFSLLGQLHAMKGSTDLACRHLEEGVRLSVYTPAYTRNQGALAILRFIVGDYAGVIAACRTGLLYDTGYIGFQALLASASALAGVPEPKRVGQALQQMRPDFRIEQFAPFLRDVAPAHRHRFVEGLRMAGWPVTAL